MASIAFTKMGFKVRKYVLYPATGVGGLLDISGFGMTFKLYLQPGSFVVYLIVNNFESHYSFSLCFSGL